jgi:hypothetical protein
VEDAAVEDEITILLLRIATMMISRNKLLTRLEGLINSDVVEAIGLGNQPVSTRRSLPWPVSASFISCVSLLRPHKVIKK